MVPKKIGIDITNLPYDYYGGVDSYCRGLINGFSQLNKKIEFQIYLNDKYFFNRKFNLGKNFKFIIIKQNIFKKILFKIYNKFFPYFSLFLFNFKFLIDFIIRNFLNSEFKASVKKNSDVLIVPNTYLSFYDKQIKTYLNIHDLQHLHYPENFSLHERCMREYQYYNSAKYSYRLISSSGFIKNDLLNNFSFLKNKKIKIISEGVYLRDFLKKKYNKKKDKIFFFPAQLWNHKNHFLVIKAFKFLKQNLNINAKLIFCGKKFKQNDFLFKYIQKNKINNVKYLGLIKFDRLLKLYRESYCVICPALYESSSLTLLEAIASSNAVIASNNKPNLEKSKYFKINFFDKNDYLSLVKAIKKIYFDEKLFKKQTNFNLKNINKFDWKFISYDFLRMILKK